MLVLQSCDGLVTSTKGLLHFVLGMTQCLVEKVHSLYTKRAYRYIHCDEISCFLLAVFCNSALALHWYRHHGHIASPAERSAVHTHELWGNILEVPSKQQQKISTQYINHLLLFKMASLGARPSHTAACEGLVPRLQDGLHYYACTATYF